MRTDIPTSSTVTDVLIWDVEQSGENAFTVTYEVDQQIKEGDPEYRIDKLGIEIVPVYRFKDVSLYIVGKLLVRCGRVQLEEEVIKCR